jgi:low affinity Fe/Cu permease
VIVSTTTVPVDDPSSTDSAPEKESLFQRLADWVSAAMGRPTNILVWLVLVAGWCLLFAVDHSKSVQLGTFMPGWFTSQGFNFPLNLVTTVAELFIGFLVAAASNRAERNLESTLSKIRAQGLAISAQQDQLEAVERKLSASLAQNTKLTKEVHELATAIHQQVCANREAPPTM